MEEIKELEANLDFFSYYVGPTNWKISLSSLKWAAHPHSLSLSSLPHSSHVWQPANISESPLSHSLSLKPSPFPPSVPATTGEAEVRMWYPRDHMLEGYSSIQLVFAVSEDSRRF